MNKLVEMTRMVAAWNQLGECSIPPLQLVVMTNSELLELRNRLIDTLYDGRMHEAPILHENSLLPGHEYYLLGCPPTAVSAVLCNVHVLEGMSSQNIKDQEYKMKKKLTTKLLKLPTSVALVLIGKQEDRSQHLGIHFVNELDFSQKRTIVIELGDCRFNHDAMCREILSKYLESVRLDIVHAYREMLQIEKQLEMEIEPLRELEIIDPEKQYSYVVRKHQQFALQVASSLTGTYVPGRKSAGQSSAAALKSNIRCKIFDLLFDTWQRQSQRIAKSIEALPLSQLSQQIKGYDSYSLNGFLSAECFKAAFSGYLFEIKEQVLTCMTTIHEAVVDGIEEILGKHFRFIVVRQQLLEKIAAHCQSIYQQFRVTFEVFVDSQVMCISVSESDFWKLNPINTSLYANQILIELKFIGGGYVRRIIEGLKESIPRMIAELYIGKLIFGLDQLSFSFLEEVMQGIDESSLIEIDPKTIESWRIAQSKLLQIKSQVKYFCLKIASHNIINNLNEKIEKYMNSMQQSFEEVEQTKQKLEEKKETFLDKVRRIFGVKKNKRTKQRVSASAEKSTASSRIGKQELLGQSSLQGGSDILPIRQAEWLIAINTNRSLPRQRLENSARAGFPPLLRPSIWLYLTKKELPRVDKLYERIDKSSIVYKQIMKDVRRTPPYQFFNGPGKEALETVLVAFSVFDEKVGYTQGMNFIASFLLRVLIGYDDSTAKYVEASLRNYKVASQQAFSILAYIVHDLKWREMYYDYTPKLFELTVQLDDKISKHLPKLFERLQESGLNTSMVFTEALMTCFCSKAPFEFAKRIFDMFLLRGESLVLSIILKLLRLNEAHILRIESQHELFNFLRSELFNHTYKHYPEIIQEIVNDDCS